MKIENWLKPLIIGLIFSLPVILPFIVSGSLLFPYITGKNFYFRIITELAFGFWIALAIANPKYRPNLSPLTYAFLVFTGVVGLAAFFGENPLRSFWSNNERMEGYITILHLTGLFFVVSNLFTADLWRRLIQTSLGISVIVAVQGFVELGQGIGRIDGSFGNSTYLGVYSLIHIFFAVLLLLREVYQSHLANTILRKEHSFMYGGIAILNTVVLYFTGTRGAFLGLIVGLLSTALIFAIRERKHPVLRKVSITLIGVVVASLLILVSINKTPLVENRPLLNRFSDVVTAIVKFDTARIAELGDARFTVWKMAWQGVKERPLLGWGQDNFGYVFSKYYDPSMFDQEQWFDRTHNVFFDWLIAAGVLGLASYLSLFVIALYFLWRNTGSVFTSYEQGIISGLIVAYFIHNLFVFDNLISYVLIVLLLSYIALKTKKIPDSTTRPSNYSVENILPIGFVVITLIIPFVVNANGYGASKSLILGMTQVDAAIELGSKDTRSTGLLNSSLSNFKKAFSYDGYNDQEILEQMVNEVVKLNRSDFSNEIKSDFNKLLLTEYDEEISIDKDARNYFILGNFYAMNGALDKAELNIKKAIELSPKKQSMYITLAQVYSAQKNEKSSLEAYRTAYELDKSFAEPKLMYALALSKNGMKKESVELLNEIDENTLLNRKYINSYVALGRYDLVTKILEKLVAEDPKNVQLKVSLSAAYLEAGDRAKSIEVLENVSKDHPEFKSQVDALIKEIRAGRNPLDN